MIKIIRANLQHLNDLATLSRTSFQQAYKDEYVSKDMANYVINAFNKKELANQVMAPDSVFFLAQENNEFVGYFKLRWDANHPHFGKKKAICLKRIYLLDSHKGKGIGKEMLESALAFSKSMGYDWMWLSVWDQNKYAIEFYKKQGFEKFGEELFQFGDQRDTDWLMKKRIS